MQRNCHEFVAYENLLGSRRGSSDRGRSSGPVGQASIEQVVPLVRRALKVLTDREVSPQLGLLKSTLLQLDSTFSERTYGAGTFRDFAQKLAAAGYVSVKEAGRNVLVELAEGGASFTGDEAARAPRPDDGGKPLPQPRREDRPPREERPAEGGAALGEVRTADAVREVRRLFQSAQNPPRWPMYIRQAKQFMRNVDSSFDERKFGFASLVDLLRACQRDGLFRMERDRQGVIRLFPGNVMQGADETPVAAARPATPGAPRPWQPGDDIPDIHEQDRLDTPERVPAPAQAAASEVVEGDVVQELETPSVIDGESAPLEEQSAEPKKARPLAQDRRRRQAESGQTAPRAEGAEAKGRRQATRAKENRIITPTLHRTSSNGNSGSTRSAGSTRL